MSTENTAPPQSAPAACSTSGRLPVIGLTPMDIIERAVKHPHVWKTGVPRWSAVGEIFSLGSTSSAELCRLFGENPHDLKLRGDRILRAGNRKVNAELRQEPL